MGWFSDKNITSANLIMATSGIVSLKEYYEFRRNIFYGTNYNTKISAFELAKYRRNHVRGFNKTRLESYGIEKNRMNLFGTMYPLSIKQSIAEYGIVKGNEYKRPYDGGFRDSIILDAPKIVNSVPRDERFYSGPPSSLSTSSASMYKMITQQYAHDFVQKDWKDTYTEISNGVIEIYQNGVDYGNPNISSIKQVISDIQLYADRSLITYTATIYYQKYIATNSNGTLVFSTTQYEPSVNPHIIRCDVRPFTTHALRVEYKEALIHPNDEYYYNTYGGDDGGGEGYGYNGFNPFTTIRRNVALKAEVMVAKYPKDYPVQREVVYALKNNTSPFAYTSTKYFTENRDIDPVVSIKASNKKLYDQSIDTTLMTDAEKLKMRGLEKMAQSLGSSTSAYKSYMDNPKIDDVAIGSFLNLNNVHKSSAMMKMGFDMFFSSDPDFVGFGSGEGNQMLGEHKNGGALFSTIELDGNSTMRLRANVDQWSVNNSNLNIYPSENPISFTNNSLWRVTVSTSFSERDGSELILQAQYESMTKVFDQQYGKDEAIRIEKFGGIVFHPNPETRSAGFIIGLVTTAKQNIRNASSTGEIDELPLNSSFVSLMDSADAHYSSSVTKYMRDKVVVSVPYDSPTDSQVLKSVQDLGGKHKFFDVLNQKHKLSSSVTGAYQYAFALSTNREYDDDLCATFFRRTVANGNIDAVTLYQMKVQYLSTDLNWTFNELYSKKDNISFCLPIEYNTLHTASGTYYEFMHLETLTNCTLLFAHQTITVPWYKQRRWTSIFQIVLIIVAAVILYFSAGTATSLSAWLIALGQAMAIAFAISLVVDFAVKELGLNANIGIIIKVVVALLMSDQSSVMMYLKLLDAGLKYYTAELEDMIKRTIKDIDDIKKKQKSLDQIKLVEDSMEENSVIAQWAKEMKVQYQDRTGVDTSGSRPVEISSSEIEEKEFLARYEPEPMTLKPTVSIEGIFNSGRKILEIEDSLKNQDPFLSTFPRS